MKFTVLLLLPEYLAEDYGKDTYLAWVDARNALQAVRKAQDQASDQHQKEGAEYRAMDYVPLFTAEGNITDITPGVFR